METNSVHKDKVQHVIVDAPAFFHNVQLQNFAENVYTVANVVSEIRDSATKKRLSVLPYLLNYKTPSTHSIQFVSDFARKVGEYRSLSATDIQVIALAYQLTKEHIGTEHLKKEPEVKKTFSSNKKPLEKSTDIVGFYFPEGKKSLDEDTTSNKECEKDGNEITLEKLSIVENEEEAHDQSQEQSHDQSHVVESENCIETSDIKKVNNKNSDLHSDKITNSERTKEFEEEEFPSENIEQEVEDKQISGVKTEGLNDDGDDDDIAGDDDDDDVGWITPENLRDAQKEMRKDIMDSLQGVQVGCLTTDFAMQNVLIQIGIPVLSLDGMLIKKAKSYVLKCHACFKTTPDTSKQFCSKCGNKTLMKVSVSVDSEGNQHYHMSKRRPYKPKGKQTSLPAPKGGKHSFNPIICEDQPLAQNRMSKKAMMRNDVFDPDYIAHNSPFVTRDTTSRSAQIGVARHQQRNAPQKKGGRRK